MQLNDLWAAIGLVLVIEGALYALFPDGMRNVLKRSLAIPTSTVRAAGIASAGGGLFVIWLIRG